MDDVFSLVLLKWVMIVTSHDSKDTRKSWTLTSEFLNDEFETRFDFVWFAHLHIVETCFYYVEHPHHTPVNDSCTSKIN